MSRPRPGRDDISSKAAVKIDGPRGDFGWKYDSVDEPTPALTTSPFP